MPSFVDSSAMVQHRSVRALRSSERSILILNSIFHLGGAERVTHGIARGLSATSYRPVICSLYEPGPGGDWFVRDGFRFYNRLIKMKGDFRVLWRLARIIHEENIELIYLINQPLTAFWGLLAAKLHRIPVIAVVHN